MQGNPARTEAQPDTASVAAQALDPKTQLAAMRTMLALDRTLLAWVRTALSLIAAGVAFDKGTRLLHENRLKEGSALIHTSHAVGLGISATCTVLVGLATWVYLKDLRSIASMFQERPPRLSSALIAAILVMIFGVLVIVVLIATDN
jgi:putative membrane protein